MDCNTFYSSLPNLWDIKNMYCRTDCTIANKKYTPSVTPEAWKSKHFKCIGPQRHFRGDFHQMKWLKMDLCCDYPQMCGGSTAHFHSTVVGTEVPAAKQSPPCQSLIGLSMQKPKQTTPPPQKKNKEKRHSDPSKWTTTNSQKDVKKERRAIKTFHVPCNM